MALLKLSSLADTASLGAWIAQNANAISNVLLSGDLGCGKTTLARHVIRNLPGAEKADFASPSFTICNWYPTLPPVCHCDLYRCQSFIPEEALDALEDNRTLAIIEWANFLREPDMPSDYLEISFTRKGENRLLSLAAHGETIRAQLPAELINP